MENQALFSSKDKHKKLKSRLLQFLFGALWVNNFNKNNAHQNDEKDFYKTPTCHQFRRKSFKH